MFRRILFLLPLLLLASACSPTFNWRELRPVGPDLQVLLPCKPDVAERPQHLAGQQLALKMAGCEAGPALFTVAAVPLTGPSQAVAVQSAWQAAVLANLKGVAEPVQRFEQPGADPGLPAIRLRASGQSPDGRALSFEGVWFAYGGKLYHAAVYAPRLKADMTEPFFSGLRLP